MDLPISKCCITGHIAKGTPKGSIGQFAGRPAYIARPKEQGKQAVIIATDVFGWSLPNARLIADAFAAHGFLTVVPDAFGKHHFPRKSLRFLSLF
jgi:dienelactone hydrolase